MNFDYVRLLCIQVTLLMMNLSYRMLVIICFLLFAYVSLDSSSAQNGRRCSVQIGRMQCKFYTNVVQTLSNEVLTYPTKQCTNLNLKKEYIRAKTPKEKRKHVKNQCSAEIYERVVKNHNQCITRMIY